MPLGVLPILISSCSSWYSLHILLSTWCDSWNLTPKNCINEQLLVFEDLEVPSHKTKFIVNYYNQMENTKKVLLCDGGCIHEKLKLATQNLHYVNVLPSVVRSTTQSFLIYYYFLDFDFKKIWIIPKKIVKHQCLKFLTVIHRVHFDNSQVYLNPKSHGVLYFWVSISYYDTVSFVPYIKLFHIMLLQGLNVYSILQHDTLVMSRDAVNKIVDRMHTPINRWSTINIFGCIPLVFNARIGILNLSSNGKKNPNNLYFFVLKYANGCQDSLFLVSALCFQLGICSWILAKPNHDTISCIWQMEKSLLVCISVYVLL